MASMNGILKEACCIGLIELQTEIIPAAGSNMTDDGTSKVYFVDFVRVGLSRLRSLPLVDILIHLNVSILIIGRR